MGEVLEQMKILIIIPVFNEEETLRGVISGIRASLPQADILVVNDGSTDSTGNIAKEEGVWVLEHPYNMGIGATMQTGFLYALKMVTISQFKLTGMGNMTQDLSPH